MMEPTLAQNIIPLISVASVILVALISPGPDFTVIVRNSIMYSRKSALYTALGVSLGILVHISYILFVFGILVNNADWVLHIVKYAGAAYLLYLAYHCLHSHATKQQLNYQHHNDISPIKALSQGFLTATLNPKTLLFFSSILTVMISPTTGHTILFIYGIVIFIESWIWFSLVAILFTSNTIRNHFLKAKHWVDIAIGIIFILVALELLLSGLIK